jgi:dihydrofolate reductase
MSMSLDGVVAGANVGAEHPIGEGVGERLHDWMFSGKSDAEVERFERDHFANTGAVIMGRTTFDLGVGPWGENPTFQAPCFVVTHAEHERITKEGGTSYTFVTGGVERALEEATAAAGDTDVVVMGGANIAQQFIERRLLDELRLHLVPVIAGRGTRLFEHVETATIDLEPLEVIEAPDVTHLRYRLHA